MTQDDALIAAARAVVSPRRLTRTVEVAGVGAALRAASGVVCTGVCSDAAGCIGFCAEHGPAGRITAWESRIVAVDWDGPVLSPCGRCRALGVQVDDGNAATRVIVTDGVGLIRNLLPDHWLLDRQDA